MDTMPRKLSFISTKLLMKNTIHLQSREMHYSDLASPIV